jgi:hypothetical protein
MNNCKCVEYGLLPESKKERENRSKTDFEQATTNHVKKILRIGLVVLVNVTAAVPSKLFDVEFGLLQHNECQYYQYRKKFMVCIRSLYMYIVLIFRRSKGYLSLTYRQDFLSCR